MPEQLFFESDRQRIRVTDSRVMVGSQTYAMGAVASVAGSRVPPNRIAQALVLLLGVFFAYKSGGSIWHWGVALAPGFLWLLLAKTRYGVELQVSSGATRALTTKDEKLARGVIDAINEAIVYRDKAK